MGAALLRRIYSERLLQVISSWEGYVSCAISVTSYLLWF